MGALYGFLSQYYWLSLAPSMTSDQHKLFWIVIVFVCILLCKIADRYTQAGKYKMLYRTYFVVFAIVEIILILHYFLAQYIEFQWI